MTDLERARAIRKKLMYLASEIEDCAIIAAALKAEREAAQLATLKWLENQGVGIPFSYDFVLDDLSTRGEP